MPDLRESALILLKAALSADPVSGTIVQAIEGFRAAAREKATETLFRSFGERLTELEGRLDADFVATDDFADLFKSCVTVADRTHAEEKLRAAANILANGLLRVDDPEKLTFPEADHFLRCLERLSLLSIEALSRIAQERPIYMTYEGRACSGPLWIDRLVELLPQLDPNLVHAALDELHLVGLAYVDRKPEDPTGSLRTTDNVSETGTVLYVPHHPLPPTVTVTPLGWRFRDHVLDQECTKPEAADPSSSPEPASPADPPTR